MKDNILDIKSSKEFYTEFAPTENKACEYVANQRWNGNNPVCPHCHSKNVYIGKDIKRPYKCGECNSRFSVKTGTIMQGSNVSVQQWLYVMFVMFHNKKGISSIRLADEIGVTQKTAWYMSQKIRECFEEKKSLSGSVEMDETFIGGKEKNKHENKKQGFRGTEGKTAVMGAISREEKQVVAYPIKEVSYSSVEGFRSRHIKKGSLLYSDDCTAYEGQTPFRVKHSRKEYVRDGHIHINSIESFWATIKRAYIGTFHFWSNKHLKKYINEFAFRYNHKNGTNVSFINKILDNGIGKIRTFDHIKGVI